MSESQFIKYRGWTIDPQYRWIKVQGVLPSCYRENPYSNQHNLDYCRYLVDRACQALELNGYRCPPIAPPTGGSPDPVPYVVWDTLPAAHLKWDKVMAVAEVEASIIDQGATPLPLGEMLIYYAKVVDGSGQEYVTPLAYHFEMRPPAKPINRVKNKRPKGRGVTGSTFPRSAYDLGAGRK